MNGNCFELSQSQKNILNLERVCGGTPINNICTVIKIKGKFDFNLITRALNDELVCNSSLRLRIKRDEDGTEYQYVEPYKPERFQLYDFSMTDDNGLERWESAISHTAIPLDGRPLYYFAVSKSDDETGGILIKLHHIITDGWSLVAMINRISENYLRLLSGKPGITKELPSYAGHIIKEKKYLESPAFAEDREYWSTQLAEIGQACTHPKAYSGANVSMVGRRKSYTFTETQNHLILAFCNAKRVAPFSAYYIALAICLGRTSGNNLISMGVPVHNRSDFSDKQTGGMFVDTVPFVCRFDDSLTVNEFNHKVTENWYELLRHQRLPFREISKLTGGLLGAQGKLFDVVLSFQDCRIFRSPDASVFFAGKWNYSGYQAESLVIHLNSTPDSRHFTVDYDYLTQIYTEADIDTMHRRIVNILTSALSEPSTPLWKIPLICDDELEQVIYKNNNTSVYTEPRTLPEAFSLSCETYPNRVALIYQKRRMTYRALDGMARRFAYAITRAYEEKRKTPAVSDTMAFTVVESTGEKANEEPIAALCLERSFELVAAMLGCALAGFAWVIIPPSQPVKRFTELITDSSASVAVGTAVAQNLTGDGLPFVRSDCISDIYCDEDTAMRTVKPSNLLYIVYTSGSSGRPKGVEITHSSFCNFAYAMKKYYGRGGILSICSVTFDVFCMESIAALLCGGTVILSDTYEQNDPDKLATLIRNFSVGFISATPSRIKAYMKSEAFRAALSSIENIICGGEALKSELVSELLEYTSARIYNQYGPSETTIGVSCKLVNGAPSVTVGSPMSNCRLYVLDDRMNPLPVGVEGELYIGGDCVGRGYHNLPELTEKCFTENPFEGGERLYRSGDLAAWDKNGEIVLGRRRDDQIKLRGVRIEPREIERRIEEFPDINQSAVRVIESAGGGIIAAYFTATRKINENECFAHAAECLPPYMIPACWIQLEHMPLSDSGKTDYKRLPEPKLTSGEDKDPTGLTAVISGIMGRQLGVAGFGSGSDYFAAGGDSLGAVGIIKSIAVETGYELKVTEIYGLRTPARIASYLEGGKDGHRPVNKDEIHRVQRELYPATPVQSEMYFACAINRDSIAYNMPGAFTLPFIPDAGRLEAAFTRLIASEDILRTGFLFENGKVSMKIFPFVSFRLERFETETLKEAADLFCRPFELDRPPLLRAAIWTDKHGVQTLLLDAHHIIGDGFSTALLLKKLDMYYLGKELSEPEVTYKDYAAYISDGKGARFEGAREYWQRRVASVTESFRLPEITSQTRQTRADSGASLELNTEPAFTARLNAFCKANGTTPSAVFCAASAIYLSRLAGSEDVILGIPVSGRVLAQTTEMAGPFINTLPLTVSAKADCDVLSLCRRMAEDIGSLNDNSFISLEEIISYTKIKRDASSGSLYDVMFSMRPQISDSFTLGGKRLNCIPLETGDVKLGLVLEAYTSGEGSCYSLHVEYADRCFDEASAALAARSVISAAEEIIRAPGALISDISCVSPYDKMELLDKPIRRVMPFYNIPVDIMSDEYCVCDRSAPAVVYHGKVMNRGEFKSRCDEIAHALTAAGARHGDKVAVMYKRRPELICAVFAVMKAGCTYLALTDTLPAERVNAMLTASGAGFVLCDAASYPVATSYNLAAALINTEELTSLPREIVTDDTQRSGEDAAQIIFTSGSTGVPKGIMIPHRALASLAGCLTSMYEKAGVERVLCSSSVLFDSFTVEVIIPLATGRCVVLADEEESMQPWRLADIIRREHAELMFSTPSRMRTFLGESSFAASLEGIKMIMSGGEVMDSELASALICHCPGDVYNMYGPAETTAFVTAYKVINGRKPTVGTPIPNARVCIMNKDKRAMPLEVGEIVIGGSQVALGYVNGEQNNGAFVPDPFIKGSLAYRTGDRGRILADGSVQYLGRGDSQVKLNGQRIETDEIAGVIMAAGLVSDTAVVIKNNALTAYVVPSAGYEEADLRSAIAKKLPQYMIPSLFVKADFIPKTVTGKTDTSALEKGLPRKSAGASPDVQIKPVEADMSPRSVAARRSDNGVMTMSEQGLPVSEQALHVSKQAFPVSEQTLPVSEQVLPVSEREIIAIWDQALCHDVASDVSFFEQGGTSLMALSILIEYFKRGWKLNLAQFYANPTVKEQYKELAGSEKAEITEKANSGVPLVTGATGFLGAHIAYSLAKESGKEVLCLARGGQKALDEAFDFYFRDDPLPSGRIIAVTGDVTLKHFGISDISAISEVFHAAADVRHYTVGGSSENVNIKGTANAIELALDAGVPLIHISTLSIAGDRLREPADGPVAFTEKDFDIGQNYRDNIYVYSKFEAEKLVREAAEVRGLDACICRIGRLVGRNSDGCFQKNADSNYFRLAVLGIRRLGYIPKTFAEFPVELTAVDLCVQAILKLRRQGSGLRVWHIGNPNMPTLAEMLDSAGIGFSIVPDAEFRRILLKGLSESPDAELAALVDFINDGFNINTDIRIDSAITDKTLESLGLGWERPDPGKLLSGF